MLALVPGGVMATPTSASWSHEVLDGMRESVALCARDGRIVYVNPVAARLFGASREALVGQVLWELSPEKELSPERAGTGVRETGFREIVERVARTGEPAVFEHYHAPSEQWFENQVFLAGEHVCVIGADITERSRMKARADAMQDVASALAESLPQVAWIARPDGSFEYLNPRWTRDTGLSIEASLGLGWRDAVHPDDRAEVASRWREAVRTGAEYEVECRYRASDGRYRWMVARAAPVGDGRLRWFGTSTDITDRKRREKGLALLASASAALASFDDKEPLLERVAWVVARRFASWACVHVCEAGMLRLAAVEHVDFEAARAFYEEAEEAPLDASSGLPALVREGAPRLYARIEDDSALEPEAPRALFRAMHARSAIIVPLVARSGPLGALSFGTTSADETFDAGDVEIGVEVAHRVAAALETVRLYELAREEQRRAEEASQLKDEFLATLSHELRTPLSAITGWVHLLRRGTLSAEKRERALEVIERNARTQAQLIDDILDVSRIVTGKLRLQVERVALDEVVEAAIDAVRPTAALKGVRLESEIAPGAVRGDAGRLQQVAWNLLTNAVKFTPAGGRVRATLRAVEGSLELVVEDTGRGIPPAFLPHLFERFRQADASTTRQHGGLGLGLALVKHIVELHGGTVEAVSEGDDQGSRFVVRLPNATAPLEASTLLSAAPSDGARPLAGLRVLVVDDEPDAREVLVSLFESAGARAFAVASAREALTTLRRERPDVLVTDIAMPGEDGYALLRQLRDLPARLGGATPAIALTAFAADGDRDRVLAAGFVAHIPKPIAPADLLAVVARVALRRKPAAS